MTCIFLKKQGGEWKGGNAGGCVNHDTWKNNPFVLLQADADCDVTIKVQSKNKFNFFDFTIFVFARLSNQRKKNCFISDVRLEKVPNRIKLQSNTTRRVSTALRFVFVPLLFFLFFFLSSTLKLFQIGFDQTLKGGQQYWIMPQTFTPDNEGAFTGFICIFDYHIFCYYL